MAYHPSISVYCTMCKAVAGEPCCYVSNGKRYPDSGDPQRVPNPSPHGARLKKYAKQRKEEPMTRKLRAYIAGPMTGLPDEGKGAFTTARVEMRRRGYEVICPDEIKEQQFYPGPSGNRANCPRDIFAVSMCDLVVVLKGWQNSVGAVGEVACAKWMKIPIMEFETGKVILPRLVADFSYAPEPVYQMLSHETSQS